MDLYLTIFERQAKFLNIPEKTWTAYLIGSLPPDIAQIIAREDEEDAQIYEKVKEMLLKRFHVTGDRGLGSTFPKRRKTQIRHVDLNDPLELAEKLDAYDNLRPGMKSNSNQTFKKKEEFRKPFPLKKFNLLEDPMNTTHLDPVEQCLDSQVTKLKEKLDKVLWMWDSRCR
ncbi:retrovirus-related Pol polyprotein from transposon 297 [Trichonephila clavipes]|nr:retrovirus-related Pol polyprotein from transposon 297 [Trichonephila clavipes]